MVPEVTNFISLHVSSIVPKTWWNDFRQYKKSLRKQDIPRSSASYILREKQKSINSQNSKHGKSGFPYYGKTMEKHKHFKFMDFLNILGSAEIQNSQNMGKVNLLSTRKVLKNTKISHILLNSQKPHHSQAVGF